jgi:alpha-1,6-mannosyltransferase
MRLISSLSVLAVSALVIVSRYDALAQLAGMGVATALAVGMTLHIFRSPALDTISLAKILLLALALRALSLLALPILEDDYFRYLWDGYRFATTGSPYGAAPAAFFDDASVPAAFQSILNFINYPEVPTIYGPVMQALFLSGYVIAPAQVLALQVQNAVLDLLLLGLLAYAGARPRWLLLYAVCPLVLKESIMTVHPDGMVGILTLAGFVAMKSRRPWLAGSMLGLAVATKISALILLPFLIWRGGWRALLAVVVVLLACYLPFILMPGSELTALNNFAHNWRFNPLLFAGIEAAFGLHWARPLAALALGTTLLVIYWFDFKQKPPRSTWPAADQAFGALLVLAPVFNPWYLLWFLPFAVLRPSRSAWAATLVLPLSYWNSSHVAFTGIGQFDLPLVVTLIEVSVLAGMAWFDWLEPIQSSQCAGERDNILAS